MKTGRKRRPDANPALMRAVLILGAPAIAIAMAGCWYAALSLAPAGLHIAEGVTVGAASEVAPKKNSTEMCKELAGAAPWITELRTTAQGKLETRNLDLTADAGALRWEVAPRDHPATGGWHQEANLAEAHFNPPVIGLLAPGARGYLAYAPAQAQSPSDRDRLVNLILNFGPTIGTFRWKERTYDYALVEKLPCFASPS